MKEIDLITRNSKYYIWTTSTLHRQFKLVWQKKKCCDLQIRKKMFLLLFTC